MSFLKIKHIYFIYTTAFFYTTIHLRTGARGASPFVIFNEYYKKDSQICCNKIMRTESNKREV